MLKPYITVFALLGCATITSAADVLVVKGTDMGTFLASINNGSAVTADTGSGETSHLGRFDLQAGETIDLTTLTITGGHYTITTNSGTISGTYAGTGQFISPAQTVVQYEVSGPITGGTGRFAGITGTLAFLGSADLVAGTFSDNIVGVVSK